MEHWLQKSGGFREDAADNSCLPQPGPGWREAIITRVMISIAQPPAVVETRMLGREIPAYPTQSDSRTPIFHVSPHHVSRRAPSIRTTIAGSFVSLRKIRRAESNRRAAKTAELFRISSALWMSLRFLWPFSFGCGLARLGSFVAPLIKMGQK